MTTCASRSGVSRTFMTLAVVYVTCLILSNLIAGKLIEIGGLVIQAADLLFPLTYVLGDIFTEVYGFRNSRSVIWLGFGCNLLAVAVFCIAVVLPYPDCWGGQQAFETVFSTAPRVLVASFAGYLLGEFSNSIVLSRLKVLMNGRRLWMRTLGSTVVGEAVDTLVFSGIVFWSVVPNGVLLQMMLVQYLLKLAYEVALTPVVYFVVARLKCHENLDVYDRGISYNPFF